MSYGGNAYGCGYGGGYGGGGMYGGGSGDRYNTGYNQYGGDSRYGGYQQGGRGGYQQRANFQRYEELDPEDEQFRKLFIGGLNLDTTVESMRAYFEKYGTIVDAVVMKDQTTKKSRGFGFVTFKLAENVDTTQKDRPHVVDGKEVETKRAMRKEDANNPEAKASVTKVFVGGVGKGSNEADIRSACELHGGEVEKVDIIKDKVSGEGRGFAFVTFIDPDHVDKIYLKKYVSINGKSAEIKKAVEKDGQRGDGLGFGGQGRGGMMGGGRGGRGHSYYNNYSGSGRGGQSGYGNYCGQGYGYGSQQYGYSGYGGGGYSSGGGGGGVGGGYDSSFGAGYSSSYSGGPQRAPVASYNDRSSGPYGSGYGQTSYGGSYR